MEKLQVQHKEFSSESFENFTNLMVHQCVFSTSKNTLLPNCNATIKIMKLMLTPYYLLILNLHFFFINCSSNALDSEREQFRILHCPQLSWLFSLSFGLEYFHDFPLTFMRMVLKIAEQLFCRHLLKFSWTFPGD